MNQKQAKRLRKDAREVVSEKDRHTQYKHEYYYKTRFGTTGGGTVTVAANCLRGVYRAFKKSLRSGQTI